MKTKAKLEDLAEDEGGGGVEEEVDSEQDDEEAALVPFPSTPPCYGEASFVSLRE